MKKSILKPVSTFFVVLFLAAVVIPFRKASAQGIITTINGKYKDWNYSQSAVFGLVKLDNTDNRTYYAITKIDPQSTRVREYNPAGIIVYTTLVRFFNGKLKLITRTDEWGDTYETIKFTYLGNNTFDVTITNTGVNSLLPCKSEKYIYKDNLLSEISYLSYSGALCDNTDGVAIIKYVRYTDKNRFSLIQEKSFYDTDGAPVASKGYGCYKVIYDRDDRGNELSEAYYGTNDEPVTDRYGVFKYKYEYDEDDNNTTKENIGLNEQETLDADSVARYGYTYQNGLLIRETRYDDKNNITRASAVGDGIAIIKYKYDDRGNNTEGAYFDENDQPINSHWGAQKTVDTYSPLDMQMSIQYFDKNQQPVVDSYGIHQFNYERDSKNRIIKEWYLDNNNNPVKSNSDQAYMIKCKYDEAGRRISISYWKDDTAKMTRWDGYHENITKYNADGQEIEDIYYDGNGNLYKTTGGFSRLVTKYNADARMSALSFFDDNTPVMKTGDYMTTNFQSVQYFYDDHERISTLEYFDNSGSPVNATISLDGTFNCHKIEFVYQGDRIIQENLYQNNSDTPIKIIDCLKNDYVDTNGVSIGYKNQ